MGKVERGEFVLCTLIFDERSSQCKQHLIHSKFSFDRGAIGGVRGRAIAAAAAGGGGGSAATGASAATRARGGVTSLLVAPLPVSSLPADGSSTCSVGVLTPSALEAAWRRRFPARGDAMLPSTDAASVDSVRLSPRAIFLRAPPPPPPSTLIPARASLAEPRRGGLVLNPEVPASGG